MGFLKAESSDWLEAHPGPVPIRRCGDVLLPFAAQGSGLAGRDQGVEFHLAELGEDGLGSSQRCLKEKQLSKVIITSPAQQCCYTFTLVISECVTSCQLCAWWRCPGCWWGSSWAQFVMNE